MRPQMPPPPNHGPCSSLPSHRLGRPLVILLMLAVVVEGAGPVAEVTAAAAASTTTTSLSSSASALSWSPLDAMFAGLGVGGSDEIVADGGGEGDGEGNAEEGDGWGREVSSTSSSSSSSSSSLPSSSSSSSGPVVSSPVDGNDGNVEGKSGYDDHRPRSHLSSFLSYTDDDDDGDYDGALDASSTDPAEIYLSTLRARARTVKTRLRTLSGSPDGKIEGVFPWLFREGPAMLEELTVTMLSRLGRVYRAARSWHQMLRLTLQESFDHIGSEKDEKVEQKVRVTQTIFYTAIGVIVVRLLMAILSGVWVVVKAVGWTARVVVNVLRMKWVRWGLMGLLIMWLVGWM